MGKGKRNRQLHFEDKQANPQKYREKKKQVRLPKWAKNTIAISLAVLIVAAVVVAAIFNSGLIQRNRILVKSATGENDVNQQMATFLLWQTMYQEAYYQYYYMSWGLYEDEYGILDSYSSAASYGIAVASTYTNEMLREGIESIADYLIELVAGADAATKANLTINDDDMKDVDEIKTWLRNVYLNSGYAGTYNKFLSELVGDGIKESDVEDAAKLVVLYTKYCNYAKLNLDDDPTLDILQAFIEKNPSGHFKVSYQQYKNADAEFLVSLFKHALADKYESEYKSLVSEEEYETILNDLIKAKNTSDNKSAEELAAAIYKKLTADKDPAEWEDIVADLTVDNKTVTKPADDADADAFESLLFGKDSKVKVGDILQSDNDGISYVINVTGGDAENGYQISYVTYTDSDYYKVFRSATKEVEELSVSAEDLREMIVNNIVDKNFNSLVINKYLTLGIAQEKATEIADAFLTDAELDALVTSLNIASAEYSSDNKADIPTEIADYIFDSERKDGDTAVIKSAGKYYIVNVFTKPTQAADTETVYTVNAGWAEYDYKLDNILATVQMKQYIKNEQDPLTAKYPQIAEWAYDAARVNGETKFFETEDAFYFAYVSAAPETVTIGTTDLLSVTLAIQEYSKDSADTTLVEALAYKSTAYKSDDVKMPAEVKAWLFDGTRQAGDAKLIPVANGTTIDLYVAYTFSAPITDAENAELTTVEAAYAKCKYETVQYINNGADTLASDYASIATWAYNTKNTVGSTTIVTIDETVYLVYMNQSLTTQKIGNTDYSYVSIGMIPYTLDDAPDANWILSQKAALIADLIQDENTTEHKSAEDKAKVLYELLVGENGDKTRWDELVADLDVSSDKATKPSSSSSTTTAVQDVLYSATSVAVGDIFQVDNSGTSYVLKITEVDGTTYKYDYVTYTDDEYYEFYRSLRSTLTASFAKDPTDLTYPSSLSTATNKWLFAGEYDEDAEKYSFERLANDVMHFAVTTTDSSTNTTVETGYYNIYIVTTAPVQDKNDEKVVYGGYLLFSSKSEAEAAKKALKGKKGFELWHAFAALTATKGEGDDATTTESTIDTAFAKSDFWADEDAETLNALGTWLFADERAKNDLAVIKGDDGYYLAYYYTAEETWTRTAKDSWVTEQVTEKIDGLMKNYSVDQKALNKIGKAETTTTTAK